MKKIIINVFWSALFLFILGAVTAPAFADINLEKEPIFVRKGFDEIWVNQIPSPQQGWHVLPAVPGGKRTAVISELPIVNNAVHTMFTQKKASAENFTFITVFTADKKDLELHALKAVFFANIGENWAVYLNGFLLRSEIHLDSEGYIKNFRHHREVLIPADPRCFKEGTNILAVRIIGDPANIDSGFHRSTPFIIGDIHTLELKRSEQTTLVLLFLYLFFGIYHLLMYIRRRKDRYNFYYGAFSVFLFIYLLSRTHVVYSYIPGSTFLHRIEYCTLYALIPLFGAFADLLLTGKFSVVLKFYSLLYALLIFITILPISNAGAIDILRIWQITSVGAILYYVFYRIAYPVFVYYKKLYADYSSKPLIPRSFISFFHAIAYSTAGNLLLGAFVMFFCSIFDILNSMFWSFDVVLTQYGFFAFTLGITLILANRFISIHNRLEENNEISRIEMEIASDIQRQLLPCAPDGLDGWEAAVSFKPKYGASGDFYDFYIEDRTLRGVSLFDVSGHGISSALITMILKPIMYRLFTAMKDAPLDAVVKKLDEHVCRELVSLENYASCILLRINEHTVEYVNAGHPDLLHFIHKEKRTEIPGGRTDFRGAPIGLKVEYHTPEVLTVTPACGDILLLFTDCIIESCSTRKGRYDIKKIIQSMEDMQDGTAREILSHVTGRFFSYIPEHEVQDDFTVICLKKTRE